MLLNEAFNFAILCHGEEGDVPLLLLFPLAAT